MGRTLASALNLRPGILPGALTKVVLRRKVPWVIEQALILTQEA